MENGENVKFKEYNPLDYENLVRSCIFELIDQKPIKFPIEHPFPGAGIYAIYYKGNLPIYETISSPNCEIPIYIGKAVWKGSRKGVKIQKIAKNSFSNSSYGPLYRRLKEHQISIEAASNLKIEDFMVRYLVVCHTWITQLESLLINRFDPLWNQCIEGFGLHNVGAARLTSKVSWWDTLHPGRSWVANMPNTRTQKEVIDKISEFRTLLADNSNIKTKEEQVNI